MVSPKYLSVLPSNLHWSAHPISIHFSDLPVPDIQLSTTTTTC